MEVYPSVTALENPEYIAALNEVHGPNLINCLEKVELATETHQHLNTFSGGMRRRFGIAVALLGKHQLVIVDEPTAGLNHFKIRRCQHILAEASPQPYLFDLS